MRVSSIGNFRRGFTLIELLVVITIIAVLAGIAVPVFNGVQERARVVQDMNNLRQLGLATQMYLNDNDGVYFLPTDNWMALLHAKYLPNWKIFQSPFDIRSPLDDNINSPVSYGFNQNSHGTNATDPLSTDKIFIVTNFIVFAPAQTSTGFTGKAEAAVTVSKDSAGPYGASAGGTHNRGHRINACMADMHTENIAWTDFHSDTPDPGVIPPFSHSSRWYPDPH
jgi:prepilin-type N-terminal cleavage/methylation domain-containing protein